MATFSDLPAEIWLHIAHFLPDVQVKKLKSLNSLFFNCYMERTWELVTITSFTSNSSIRSLQRIVDPCVGTRTKKLVIRLDSQSDDLKTNIISALPLLPNIASLKITVFEQSMTHYVDLFQTIASSPMANTLGRMWLVVPTNTDLFAKLATGSFENLIKLVLDLELTTAELPHTLASFLCHLAPSLQLLRISNQSYTHDLSPIFDSLSIPFPRLVSLLLFFGFSHPVCQSSHQSLLRFIVSHNNNLLHLHLSLEAQPEADEHLGLWLADLVDKAQFPSLQTLAIHRPGTQTGASAVLTLIKRTAPTLTSLTISSDDSPFTYEGAALVLDALTEGQVETQRLERLGIYINELSVPFLELLASKLPQLESLSLAADNVVGSNEYPFCDLLQHRRYNPDIVSTEDILHTWKLRRFSIGNLYKSLAEETVSAVACAVPGLGK